MSLDLINLTSSRSAFCKMTLVLTNFVLVLFYNNIFVTLPLKYFYFSIRCYLKTRACGLWPVTCDLWPVVCGLRSVVGGLWQVACGL